MMTFQTDTLKAKAMAITEILALLALLSGCATTLSGTVLFQKTSHYVNARPVWDIHSLDLQTLSTQQLTTSPPTEEHDSSEAVFAASPEKIIFTTRRHEATTAKTFELYTMDYNGQNLNRLTNNIGIDDSNPAWCTDTSKIVFTKAVTGQGGEIMSMNIDGKQVGRIIPASADNFNPTCSPDGTKITFIRFRSIYISDFSGSNEFQLTSANMTCNSVSWSPDGLKVAASCLRNSLQLVIATMEPAIDVQTGDPVAYQELTNPPVDYNDGNPVWSPNSDAFMFVRTHTTLANKTYHYDIITQNTSHVSAIPDGAIVTDWK